MISTPSPSEIRRFIGRHVDKQFDWNAFPRSEGYPNLDRGQMRYIGAGGSPKHDDPNTLKAEHFTLSIIDLPSTHFGASHYHDDCEEIFLGIDGYTTIGFTYGDEAIELTLGPKDLLLLPIGLPHAYRNDSRESTRLSVMVGNPKPHAPIYVAHPTQSERAETFGAAEGKATHYSPTSDDPRHAQIREHLVRYVERPVQWHAAGFGCKVYVGAGGPHAANFRQDLMHLPVGKGVKPYERDVEDAYFVLEGVVTVGWEENGRVSEERLGPKDVIFNPAGRRHYFRNDGFTDAQFMMVVGTSAAENIDFVPAS